MTTTLIIGLLIPLLGTMLGSAFVFFMKEEMSVRLRKSSLPVLPGRYWRMARNSGITGRYKAGKNRF